MGRQTWRSLARALGAAALFGAGACGESTEAMSGLDAAVRPDAVVPDSGLGPDADRALVGTWAGTVSGSFGNAEVTAELRPNGRFETASTTNSLYCPLMGRWRLASTNVVLDGNDDCDGTQVILTAPYSVTELTGTWSASSGNGGRFTLAKQP